jgi:fimbrial chaperone protein
MTALCAAAPVEAASLQVTPILVDVTADAAAATTVTLKNSGGKAVNVQLRVFKWSQVNGEDKYEETTDVSVSPPMVAMKGNGEYVVRVVRTARTPIRGEESYRFVADELPDADAKKAGVISLLVRHSVPVFFHSNGASPASVQWNVAKRGGRIVVEGSNTGERRVRVSRLKAEDGAGNAVNYGDGLVGYVLGKSSVSFPSRGAAKGFSGSAAKISLTSEAGVQSASATVR